MLCSGLLAEKLVQHLQWQRSDSQNKPDVEIENEVPDIEMPGLSAIDIRPLSRPTKDIVQNNVQWYADQFLVEEGVDGFRGGLVESQLVARVLQNSEYQPERKMTSQHHQEISWLCHRETQSARREITLQR